MAWHVTCRQEYHRLIHRCRFCFFYCSAGYTVTCSLINTYVNRMGPHAMAERSDDFTFTSIRLQLRHMAHWDDNSVAVSHLHHIFGFGRKYDADARALAGSQLNETRVNSKILFFSVLLRKFPTVSAAVSTAFPWSRNLHCKSRRRHAWIYARPLFPNVRSFQFWPNRKR